MVWSTRSTVSVIELILYFPVLLGSITVTLRHGSSRASGWRFTVILCLVRIVGSICQLVAVQNPTDGVVTATQTLESIGISPLLFATAGLLSRYLHWVNVESRPRRIITFLQSHLIHTLILVGLILTIVGTTSATPAPDGTISVQETTKAGALLYMTALATITMTVILSLSSISSVPEKERTLPVVVAIAIPFIFVRVLYSILAAFLNNYTFNSLDGSVVVWACMTLPEEIVVVILYVLLGFRLDKADVPNHTNFKSFIKSEIGQELGARSRHGRREFGGNSYNLDRR